MVGEIEKGARGGELLALEEHWRPWRQQHQSSHRPVAAGAGQLVAAQATAGVRDLVVILDESHKRRRLQPPCRGATALLLPLVPLSLVKVAPFQRRDKLLRCPLVISIVGLLTACNGDHSAMMEVIVPQCIESISALRGRSHQPGVLWLVLRHKNGRSSTGRAPYLLGDRRENMHGRLVIDLLRGIEAQSIEMKLIDPITGIGEKELAHG